MARLTKKEQAWLDELQEVLDRCPSKRLGFYTIGDAALSVYDSKEERHIEERIDKIGAEFGYAVDLCKARLGYLRFPANVHSTAG
jgi:hypothetical protein